MTFFSQQVSKVYAANTDSKRSYDVVEHFCHQSHSDSHGAYLYVLQLNESLSVAEAGCSLVFSRLTLNVNLTRCVTGPSRRLASQNHPQKAFAEGSVIGCTSTVGNISLILGKTFTLNLKCTHNCQYCQNTGPNMQRVGRNHVAQSSTRWIS